MTKATTTFLFVIIVCLCGSTRADLTALTGYNFSDASDYLKCFVRPTFQLSNLTDDCSLLKVYDYSKVVSMDRYQLKVISSSCACQLSAMGAIWDEIFYDRETLIVADRVTSLIQSHNDSYPEFIWSDLEVMFYHVSIRTATQGFFQQLGSNKTFVQQLTEQELITDKAWRSLVRFCKKLVVDKHHMYSYLENLKLLDVEVFFQLVSISEPVKLPYDASKACKILNTNPSLNYQLVPDNFELVVADPSELKYIQQYQSMFDHDDNNNLDMMLRGASAKLANCRRWHRLADPMAKLSLECPMMLGDQLPVEWVQENPSISNRSSVAIKCACQLLLHKDAWRVYFKDSHVTTMLNTITDFFNREGVPDLTSMSMTQIRSWYEDVMSRLTQSRQKTILEVVRSMNKSEDIVVPLGETSNLQKNALETIRRACNFIVFNHRKGSVEDIELKLVKYLDNLQYISQDPLFVFHLTLQDPNLFKLRALTRMCQPYVN